MAAGLRDPEGDFQAGEDRIVTETRYHHRVHGVPIHHDNDTERLIHTCGRGVGDGPMNEDIAVSVEAACISRREVEEDALLLRDD